MASAMAGGAPVAAPHPEDRLAMVASAAAVASVLTKAVLHPIDTVKCRVQACPRPMLEVFRMWRGRWGARELFRGFGVKSVSYIPFQSLYMTSYTVTKQALGVDDEEHRVVPRWAGIVIASGVADTVSSLIRVPMQTVKIRLQANVYDTLHDAGRCLRADGIRRLMRLFVPQTLVHDVPYSIMQWATYEYLRPILLAPLERTLSDGHASAGASAATSLVAGGVAGSVAGFVTTPLDVIKTRTVAQSSVARSDNAPQMAGGPRTTSVRVIARTIMHEEGIRGFFRGAGVRVVWLSTNMGLYLALFEALKTVGAQYSAYLPGAFH